MRRCVSRVRSHPRVEARLDELLGHPETCPHGNPIDAETAKRRPPGTRLSDTPAGERATIYRITEEAEEDAGLLSYLEARGAAARRAHHHPGALGVARFADPRRPARPRDARVFGRPLVRVLPGEADPGLFHHVPAQAVR